MKEAPADYKKILENFVKDQKQKSKDANLKFKDLKHKFQNVNIKGKCFSLDDYLRYVYEGKNDAGSLLVGDKFSKNPDKYFAVENVFGGLNFKGKPNANPGQKRLFSPDFYVLSETDCIIGYITQHVHLISHFSEIFQGTG